MIDEQYNRLTLTERDRFSRVVNQLLAGTYLLADLYDAAEGMTRTNRDYLFVERHFELFRDYLMLAGFGLERDSSYGVIFLSSSYDGNRVHFDKLTTVMLYTLRLMYEEERQKLNLSRDVIITVSELVRKMLAVGAVPKKPGNVQLHAALRRLARFHMIQKLEGSWEMPDTRILILPSILFVVSNEQISNMGKLVEERKKAKSGSEDEWTDTGESGDEEPDTGDEDEELLAGEDQDEETE